MSHSFIRNNPVAFIKNNRFIFNGHVLSNLVAIESVTRELLPQKDIKVVQIPGKHGSNVLNSTFGVRKIVVDVRFLEETYELAQNRANEVAFLLNSDVPKQLYLNDLEYFNKAILLGGVELQRELDTIKARLIFYCYDPFNYSVILKTITLIKNQVTQIENTGFETPFETITIQFTTGTSGTSTIKLNNSEHITLTNPSTSGTMVIYTSEVTGKKVIKFNGINSMALVSLNSDFFDINSGRAVLKFESSEEKAVLTYYERFL